MSILTSILETVFNDEATFESLHVTSDATIDGNLTVNGDTTTLNIEQLYIEDNAIILNSNVSGTPTLDAFVRVQRGDSTNAQIKWNETTDKWQAGLVGAEQNLATENYVASSFLSSATAASTYLPISGGTFGGNINMGLNRITNLGMPTNAYDSVTKYYVDINFLPTEIASSTYLPTATAASTYLPLTGGVISNDLTVSNQLFCSTLTTAKMLFSNANRVQASTVNFDVGNGNVTMPSGKFAVGTSSIASSAISQIDSTSQGFLPPRMTQTQKLAITSPVEGLQVYDTTLKCISYYNGTNWFIPSYLKLSLSTFVQCTSWNSGTLVPFDTSVSSADSRITFSTTTLTIADIGTYQLNLCGVFTQANADGSEARARISFNTAGGSIIAVADDQVLVTDGLTSTGSATISYLLTTTTTNSTYEFKCYSASGGTVSQFAELTDGSQGFIKRIL
jgi:hypothetical protein